MPVIQNRKLRVLHNKIDHFVFIPAYAGVGLSNKGANLMHSSSSRTSLVSAITRIAPVAFFATFALGAVAQQPSAAVRPTLDLSHPALSLEASLKGPLDLASREADSTSSSSSSLNFDLPADPSSPGSDLQPPPRRRRYGRPNYSDKYRNADGSNRFAFVAGGGVTLPVGSASSDFLNTGYRFEAGAGVNMSKKLGVLFQFDYDHFGIPGNVLANQETLYTVVSQDTTGAFQGLGGSTHIWSLTLNPTFNLYQGDSLGVYAVVGGGFYHKVTNFTVPSVGQYCDYYGYCYQYQTNQSIDRYTSNSPGATGGLGVTYKFSRWSNERLFAEARYVHTFNQARLGDPSFTRSGTGIVNNFYPPNSNETSYIPITVGIRF